MKNALLAFLFLATVVSLVYWDYTFCHSHQHSLHSGRTEDHAAVGHTTHSDSHQSSEEHHPMSETTSSEHTAPPANETPPEQATVPVEYEVVEIPEKVTKTSVFADEESALYDHSPPFMVVAGAFRKEPNAIVELSRIQRLGFDGELVRFHASSYHTVLAGRFPTAQKAGETVARLQKQQIPAYIIRRREVGQN